MSNIHIIPPKSSTVSISGGVITGNIFNIPVNNENEVKIIKDEKESKGNN